MRRELFRRTWRPLLLVLAAAARLPASGQSRLPPDHADGPRHAGSHLQRVGGRVRRQGNPCTLKVTGALVDVTAVFTGRFVPPAPPAPPAAATPSLSVDVEGGVCPFCFVMVFSGTGFHANSPIDLTFSYASPASGGSGIDEDAATSDGSGSWEAGYHETCEFDDGTYSGPVVIDVTATDAEGASASTQVNGTCPETP